MIAAPSVDSFCTSYLQCEGDLNRVNDGQTTDVKVNKSLKLGPFGIQNVKGHAVSYHAKNGCDWNGDSIGPNQAWQACRCILKACQVIRKGKGEQICHVFSCMHGSTSLNKDY